jgi:hypothetical protein
MNKTPLLLLLLFVNCEIFSQTGNPHVIAFSGGNGSNSEVSFCWTVGEVVISELSDGSYFLAQGFHQGGLAVVSKLENLPPNGEINVFPNPVENFLTIELQEISFPENWTIEVYSPDGKLVLRQILSESPSNVDFSSFPAGAYLLRIGDNQNHFKSYNIIKQ